MKYTKEETQKLATATMEYINTNNLAKDDIPHLVEVMQFNEYRYYVLNDPLISDFEYDKLYQKLKLLERDFPEALQADSPTQRVSPDLIESFNTVSHTVPMLSLDNSYSAEDLIDFDRKLKELAEEEHIEYVVEPKFDGSSIAIIYEDDVLVRAATRGDGVEGDEVTPNVRTIQSIPYKANFSAYNIKKIELRGEIVIRRDVFEKINELRAQNGEKLLANARNSAAGALRVKNPKEARARGLDAFLYQIGYAVDNQGNDLLHSQFTNHQNNISFLAKLGFKVPIAQSKLCYSIEEVANFIANWENKRESFDYDTDGMVIKANKRETQDKAGFTAHHPRWAIAFKFKAKQATTKLLDVEYQVGRTGAITPVGKVQATQLAGVIISSISLHNDDVIKQKDLRIGDTVLIERAGDVIPYVVKALEELRDGSEKEIIFPTKCPVCASNVERPIGEAIFRCVNAECPAQIEERIIHFASKDAMDIDSLGRDIVKRFCSLGILSTIEDIYQMDYNRVFELEGWGEKSIERLKQGVEASKERKPERILYALGIRHVGLTTAKTLMQNVQNIFELENWTIDQLQELPDIGPKVAQSMFDFFKVVENIEMLKRLEGFGLNFTKVAQIGASNKLAGKTFLFTGTLNKMGRNEAKNLVEDNGGKLISSVSKNLDYLVAGEKAGSKLTKAQSIPNIEIISEDAFLAMIS